jgi:copper chaperone CopZ
MDTVSLTSPDISCAHCKSTIEREIGRMPGIEACEVDVDTKQVRVTYNPAQTSRRQIVERLDDEGYPVAG